MSHMSHNHNNHSSDNIVRILIDVSLFSNLNTIIAVMNIHATRSVARSMTTLVTKRLRSNVMTGSGPPNDVIGGSKGLKLKMRKKDSYSSSML